jgi:Mrp family chromosome partitioning ATPase
MRHEERVKLSNAAYRHFSDVQKAKLPKEILQHEIDQFCADSHPVLIKALAPKLVSGKSPAPPEWLCDGLVLKGGGTVLYGEQGKGKSTTALLVAASVDSGDNTFFNVPAPKTTLFVNLERSAESLARRLGTV